MKQEVRKTLIIMTPKSLLRHKLCISKVDDFTNGQYQQIIDDSHVKKENIKKIIFCSGKIYYDLYEYRENKDIQDTAIIRVEQLYPIKAEF